VPGDGNVPALRALLNQLDRAAIEVEGLSIHTPDLDDVFFALTGQPDAPARSDPDHPGSQKQKVTQS
jgi:ABC-2 type transport system ATP-binding protein